MGIRRLLSEYEFAVLEAYVARGADLWDHAYDQFRPKDSQVPMEWGNLRLRKEALKIMHTRYDPSHVPTTMWG